MRKQFPNKQAVKKMPTYTHTPRFHSCQTEATVSHLLPAQLMLIGSCDKLACFTLEQTWNDVS